MNLRKSYFHVGGIANNRMNQIVNLLGFSISSLHFTYLGVQIFKEIPKSIYLQPIRDKVKIKLTSWKASIISISCRVQLVNSMVQSILLHTMSIYSWIMFHIKGHRGTSSTFILIKLVTI